MQFTMKYIEKINGGLIPSRHAPLTSYAHEFHFRHDLLLSFTHLNTDIEIFLVKFVYKQYFLKCPKMVMVFLDDQNLFNQVVCGSDRGLKYVRMKLSYVYM